MLKSKMALRRFCVKRNIRFKLLPPAIYEFPVLEQGTGRNYADEHRGVRWVVPGIVRRRHTWQERHQLCTHRRKKSPVQRVLTKLLEPFRKSDRDEVVRCLREQGGLNRCAVAFYAQADIGADGVWDNWRLEGPSFVWHFRGKPHVHVWVHVANSPAVRLNSANHAMLE